ncbi:hypothetical protein V2G26_009574 [Clonostachys chloroleuca]
MTQPGPSRVATRWAVRIIPCFIVAAFAFAKYAVIAHLCVDYLYRQHHERGLAIALIVLYFVFFLLALAAYVRTVYTTQTNPGLVPWSERRQRVHNERKALPHKEREDLESQSWSTPDLSPDSPGLESFYTKTMFICEPDGRPRWCSLCWSWKPDRSHHSSELGRCVRKMDHLCPWVGGMVSETSFNFFAQFTYWVSMYLAVCVATAGYCLHKQIQASDPLDWRVVVILALSGLFGLFAFGMSMTSTRYIVENITNIDVFKRRAVHYIAIRVPRGTPSTASYQTVTFPLPGPPGTEPHSPTNGFTPSSRDRQAVRTFAIVKTEPGENPFDLGYWRNFKAVMGNNIFEWLLPIRHSPCCNHDNPESFYEFGSLIEELKERHGLPQGHRRRHSRADEVEMVERRPSRD